MMKWMPNCKDVTHMVSESMDRKLPFSRRMGMWFHLMMCRYCLRFRRQIMSLRKLGCQDDPADVQNNAALPPEARERIKLMIRNCNEEE